MTTIAPTRTAPSTPTGCRAVDRRDTLSAYDKRVKLFNRCCVGVLIAFALIWLVPIAWAIDTALKPNGETTKTDLAGSTIPTLDSFPRCSTQGDILELVRVQLHHLAG